MVPKPSSLTTSPRHQNVFEPKESEIPQILAAAWAVCTPADTPLVDQLNAKEKTFLILFSEYISTALSSPLSASDPATVLSDILMTARHRLSLLSKEVSLSPNYVVIVTILQLLANLFSSDNMKYQDVESFLEVYPVFQDRCSLEQDKLFHTANWMHILFKITTAKKNKGMVMEIIPKFVEGKNIHYVTGSGQTQPTKDRVTIYETEGDVKPIKRLQRKTKKELIELTRKTGGSGSKTKGTKRKATYVKRKTLSSTRGGSITRGKRTAEGCSSSEGGGVRESHSPSIQHSEEDLDVCDDIEDMDLDPKEEEEASEQQQEKEQLCRYNSNPYLPLQTSFSMAPPIPVRRSQSSFSEAAAAIANFNQTVLQNIGSDNNKGVTRNGSAVAGAGATASPTSYVCSPRECYLDVEANGTIRKTTSANWGMSHSLSSSSLGNLSLSCLSPRACSSSLSTHPDYQLQMLREVSEDSDFSAEEKGLGGSAAVTETAGPGSPGAAAPGTGAGVSSATCFAQLLPPYLMHQQSLTLSIPTSTSSFSAAVGSPNPQSRTLERFLTSSSLDEEVEGDFELLEVLSRQASFSWLSRSASNSSLSGGSSREAAGLSINA